MRIGTRGPEGRPRAELTSPSIIAMPYRYRDLYVSVALLVQRGEIAQDLRILLRGVVAQASDGLLAHSALPGRGLRSRSCIAGHAWQVGPSWRACGFRAGELLDAE